MTRSVDNLPMPALSLACLLRFRFISASSLASPKAWACDPPIGSIHQISCEPPVASRRPRGHPRQTPHKDTMESTQTAKTIAASNLSPATKTAQAYAGLFSLSLLLVTLVWGSTVPVLKVAAVSLSGVEISALRFVIAAACLLPWAMRASPQAWRDGASLGALVLGAYVAQAYGLQFISSNRSAFLTSPNVLMVPLFGLAFGNRISWRILLSTALACCGIGLMSWDGDGHLLADVATLLGAAGYALYVILLSRCAARHRAQHLAATQIVCMAVLGCLWMVLDSANTDRLQTLGGRLDLNLVASLVYLGVVASAGMLFLQAFAQRYVSADKAALIYAMEPIFAALFAWWWLSEVLTVKAVLGGVMVVGAVVLCEWRSSKR